MTVRGAVTLTALAAGLSPVAGIVPAAAQTPAVSVASLLQSGYEIRTAFADTSGGAYLILQRGTSAYMCHSAPRQTCEKLN